MKKVLAAFAFIAFTAAAFAQVGPGPGPTPDPWTQNGGTLSYDQGGVILTSTVAGGSKGAGTLNAAGIYLNGVAVITSAGAPVQSVFGRTGTILAQTGDYSFSQISGTIATTQIPTGTSVADPGTGKLESLLPIQTTTGASKTFVAADLQKETRRSNAGSSMTDTFPASSVSGMANGARIVVSNVDASAVDLITAGSGTSFTSGSTDTIEAGRSVTYTYDAPNATWRKTFNTGSAAIFSSTGSNTIGDIVTMGSIYGGVQDSGKSINNIVTGPASATNNDLACFNGTTGKVLLDCNIASANVAQLNAIQTWTAAQSFNSGNMKLNGSGSGTSIVNAPATGGGTATLFQGTDTILGAASTATMTGKTYDTAGSGNVFKLNGQTIVTASDLNNNLDANRVKFQAVLTSPATNVTGDGTSYVIAGWTTAVNTGAAFNATTGVFTAPANGTLYLSADVNINSVAVSHTAGSLQALTSTVASYFGWKANPGAERDTSNQIAISMAAPIHMATGNTVDLVLNISGSTKIIGIQTTTWIGGYFVAD